MKLSLYKNNFGILSLKICVAIILIVHGVAGMFNGGVNGFGEYLGTQGFGSLGVPLAWVIKLSHVLAAGCILLGKWQLWPCLFTILILIIGIFWVHLPNGWFVVGGGVNGVEFNLLLISALMALVFQKSPSTEIKS